MLNHPFSWMIAGAGGLFFLLIYAILISPVVIEGFYQRAGTNDDAELKIKALYGILHYQVKVPIIEFTGQSMQFKQQVSNSGIGFSSEKQMKDEIDVNRVARAIDKMKHALEITYNLKGWMRKTLSRVKLKEWKWITSVGTGDAMWTAMATGIIWSVQTSVFGVLSQMVRVQVEPKMSVNPIYQHPAFTTEWSCIAKISFGYAILAGLQLLVRMKKVKGGEKQWQNILFKA